jgi:hypothetical protein
VAELTYDIYENNLAGKVRGVDPWTWLEHKKTQKAINL